MESSIIIFLVRCEVDIVVLSFILELLLIAVHITFRTVIVLLLIIKSFLLTLHLFVLELLANPTGREQRYPDLEERLNVFGIWRRLRTQNPK